MPPSDRPKQIPLDLAVSPRLSRDDLLKGPSNQAAIEAIDRWPVWQNPIVILVGPAGSGKSHLAAIWQEKSNARLVVPEDLREALKREVDTPLLIGDIGGAPIDDTALFHLVNTISQTGGSMLLTSRKPPQEWKLQLADLQSRMMAATIIAISEPDDALLASVIAKLFADRQVNVEANVISFLVNRMERSLAAAADIVERLDRLALEKNVRISRSLAGTLVSDADPRQTNLDL